MKAILIAALLSLSNPLAAADYGIGHGIVTGGVYLVATEVNKKLYPDQPKLQKLMTGIVTGLTAMYFCNRESNARGDNFLGDNLDSNMDCAVPAAIATVTLFEVTW